MGALWVWRRKRYYQRKAACPIKPSKLYAVQRRQLRNIKLALATSLQSRERRSECDIIVFNDEDQLSERSCGMTLSLFRRRQEICLSFPKRLCKSLLRFAVLSDFNFGWPTNLKEKDTSSIFTSGNGWSSLIRRASHVEHLKIFSCCLKGIVYDKMWSHFCGRIKTSVMLHIWQEYPL